MPILRRSVVQFCSAPLVRFHTALDMRQKALHGTGRCELSAFRYVAVYRDAIERESGIEEPVEVRRTYRCRWDSEEEAEEQLIGFLDERRNDDARGLVGVILEATRSSPLDWKTPSLNWLEVSRLPAIPALVPAA